MAASDLGTWEPHSHLPTGRCSLYSCESREGAGWRCDVRVPTAPPTGLWVRSLRPNWFSNLYNQRLPLSETHVLKGQNEEVTFMVLASMDSVVTTAQNGPQVSIAVCSQETYGRVASSMSWGHCSLCLISCRKSYQQSAGWDI